MSAAPKPMTTEDLDPAFLPKKPPIWTAKEIKRFRSLSDIRLEQSAVYWLWRKHGLIGVGHMATAVQALAAIRSTLEAERQLELEALRAEVAELRAELQRQEELRVVSQNVSTWPAAIANSAPN